MNRPFQPLLFLIVVAASAGWTARPAQALQHIREPVIVDASTLDVEQVAIASDAELTAVLYREGAGSQRLFCSVTDGRALGPGFGTAEAVSAGSNVARELQPDSILVVGDQAFAVWSDDALGGGATRLWFNRRIGGAWGAPAALPTGAPLVGSDLADWSAAARVGLNGRVSIAILAAYSDPAGDRLYLHLSTDAGASFAPPREVSALGVSPAALGSVAVDVAGALLHCVWTDDRNGTQDVWHRHALIDFFGGVHWQRDELALSSGSGTDAVGELSASVNGEAAWSGTDGKYVGAAWTQDDGSGDRTLMVAVSQDGGLSFLPEAVVGHTAQPGVDVADFDFEISGDTFHAVWQDESLGAPQVFRMSSEDGTVWDGSTGSDFVQLSAVADPAATGRAPRITRSWGEPDGTCVLWIERRPTGFLIVTAFADQSLGGAYHDEYPELSAPLDVAESDFGPAACAYNFRYNNFALAWLAAGAPGSGGEKDVLVGGYRPQTAEVEDFSPGSLEFFFAIDHLPFQDLHGLVLIARTATIGPGLRLPDGRATGLVRDGWTEFGLSRLGMFSGPNVSVNEGVQTPPIPTAGIPPGATLRFVGIGLGPFGQPHVLTDVAEATFQ